MTVEMKKHFIEVNNIDNPSAKSGGIASITMYFDVNDPLQKSAAFIHMLDAIRDCQELYITANKPVKP